MVHVIILNSALDYFLWMYGLATLFCFGRVSHAAQEFIRETSDIGPLKWLAVWLATVVLALLWPVPWKVLAEGAKRLARGK